MMSGNEHFYEGHHPEGVPLYQDFYQGAPPPQNQYQHVPHGWQGTLPPQFYSIGAAPSRNPSGPKMFMDPQSQRLPPGFSGLPSGMVMGHQSSSGFSPFKQGEPSGSLSAMGPGSSKGQSKKETKTVSTKKQPKGTHIQATFSHFGSHPFMHSARKNPYSQSSIPSADGSPSSKMDTGFQREEKEHTPFNKIEQVPGINLEFIDDEDKSIGESSFNHSEGSKNIYANPGPNPQNPSSSRSPKQMLLPHAMAPGPPAYRIGPQQELQNIERVELIIPNLNDSNYFKHCGFCRKCKPTNLSLVVMLDDRHRHQKMQLPKPLRNALERYSEILFDALRLLPQLRPLCLSRAPHPRSPEHLQVLFQGIEEQQRL
jgi:hypothetical protein